MKHTQQFMNALLISLLMVAPLINAKAITKQSSKLTAPAARAVLN